MSTELIRRLLGLSRGFEEWRVESPEDGSYCMSFTRDDELNPEQAALGWLAEHLLRHPDSQFAGYVVKKHVVKTRKDQALDEAAAAHATPFHQAAAALVTSAKPRAPAPPATITLTPSQQAAVDEQAGL